MKYIFNVLFLSSAVLLSGCQAVAPIGGTTAQQEGVAAIEEAITNNEKNEVIPAPPSAPLGLLPPLNFDAGHGGSGERFDITAEALPARDFFMGLVQGTSYNMIVHEEVGGTVSLALKDVTVDEVMRAIQREGSSDTQVSAGSVSTSGDNSSTDEVIGTRISTKTSTDFWGNLQSTLNTIVSGEGRKVVVTPQTGVVVVRALPSELKTVRAYLDQAELILHRQVVIEAKILEVTLNSGFQAGVNWTALGELSGGKSALFSQSSTSLTNSDSIGGIFKADLSLGDFTAVIELLGTQGDVQVLSSPRVSTVNNQKAIIKVGTDEFFVTEVENTTTTGTSTTNSPSIELTPFFSGIALDVTPQISADGRIVLHIHPAVSRVEDQQKRISIGSDEFNIPLALSTIRESDSIVKADSGQVIVIGGLMQSISNNTDAEAPGLSDIPGIGNLFKQKRYAANKTELVILLRPVLSNFESQQSELKRSLDAFRPSF